MTLYIVKIAQGLADLAGQELSDEHIREAAKLLVVPDNVPVAA
ncbi:MAG TPA: hypothetical protein VMW93_04525 [bacterium]|nr:hypothetical protein [bacterium]